MTNALVPPYDLMSDHFSVNNEQCPGKCVIHGAGTPREWDIRKGYGLSGATVVFMGNTVSRFDIDVTIFTQQDFDAWSAFYGKYLQKPDQGKYPRAVGIYHPQLAVLGIGSMVVEDVTQFEQDDTGGWTCTIKCIEFKKPKPLILRPLGSIPGTGTKQPTAADKFDQELQDKQKQLQALHDQDAVEQ